MAAGDSSASPGANEPASAEDTTVPRGDRVTSICSSD
jgi:hypothetical protein